MAAKALAGVELPTASPHGGGGGGGEGVGHGSEPLGVEAARFVSAAVSGLLCLHDDPRPFAGLCLAFAASGLGGADPRSSADMLNGGDGGGGGGEGTAAKSTCRGEIYGVIFFGS